jgi:hypothetical protein
MFEDLLHIRAVFAYNGEFTTVSSLSVSSLSVSSLSAHLFQPERYTAIRSAATRCALARACSGEIDLQIIWLESFDLRPPIRYNFAVHLITERRPGGS